MAPRVILADAEHYAYAHEFDKMITDPPYSAHVHAAATSQSKGRGTRKRDLGFASLSRRLRLRTAFYASRVRSWSLVYSDVEDSSWLRLAVQARGIEYIRTIPWVRWSMPQLTGDRPPQGFEHLLVFHPKGAKQWNGPGQLTHLNHLALRGEGKHKCEKPLDQCLDLVSWFTQPGERVFDPFAGSGAIGLACRILGRDYLGLENDEKWQPRAHARITASGLSERDTERLQRWIFRSDEPEAVSEDPGPVRRATARKADKATGLAFLAVNGDRTVRLSGGVQWAALHA
jgi:site-specific DNA-methyltransferase (adenine-specific)